MGHSKTCNFSVKVYASGSTGFSTYGAMSIKDIKGILLSEQDYQKSKGHSVISLVIRPQTSRGRNLLKGHGYAIMDCYGKIGYYNTSDTVPIYTFE